MPGNLQAKDWRSLKKNHKKDKKRKNKSDDESNNENQDEDKLRWNSMILATLSQDKSDSELVLRPMNRVFIWLRTIMFLTRIYILSGILTQIMFVIGGFGNLRCVMGSLRRALGCHLYLHIGK